MLSPSAEDCFADAVQDFLICTTIHKAHDVGVATADLYVRVTLDKEVKTTKTFSQSQHPYFNEYFVFELKCTLAELLRLTILYEMKKRSTCKRNTAVGELLIDLHTVWIQPNHSYFKKWGHLETPIAAQDVVHEQTKGYLQIDLAIVSQSTNPNNILAPAEEQDMLSVNKWHIDMDYDNIEKNLLQSLDPKMQCNIRYFVSLYGGYFVRKSDYLIQVSFAGFHVFTLGLFAFKTNFISSLKYRFHPFKGKTQICKATNHPVWNEEITFAWIFPSLAQQFLIQIFSHEYLMWRCIAECDIHFDEIAFNKKPALGPTFIHLYDPVDSFQYVGRLLLEIRSQTLDQQAERVLGVKLIRSLDETNFWIHEFMQIEFLPLQGDFIHASGSACKVGIRLAEYTAQPVECVLKTTAGKFKFPHYLKYFRQESPYKSSAVIARLPDLRSKYESDNFMQEMLDFMRIEIETFRLFQLKYHNQFHMQAKCLRTVITNILQRIKSGVEGHRFDFEALSERTAWDINRQLYLLNYFAQLPKYLHKCRKTLQNTNSERLEAAIDAAMQDIVQQAAQLNSLSSNTRLQDDWPDLFLTLSMGSKEFGVCRVNAKLFLYMQQSKSNNYCWRVKSFVFKDINCQHTCFQCGCTVGILLGALAIVNKNERENFLAKFNSEWVQVEPLLWTPNVTATNFNCHIFIHQAKVRPGSDSTGLCDAHIRIVTGEHIAETKTMRTTLTPIWNNVITLPRLILPGSIQWYLQHPPLIAVELYDMDKLFTLKFEGCGLVAPTIISSERADEAEWESQQPSQGLFKSKNTMQKFMRLKNATPPPLKWVPIAWRGMTHAEVLMSAEIVEVFGDAERLKTISSTPNIEVGIPNAIRPNMMNYVLEVIFVGLRNYTKATITGKHRIKIMMADLVLKSGLSTSRIHKSINFLIAYASGVVSLPDQHEYWPAIITTDVIVSSAEQEHTVGAALIANSKNFLQKNSQIKCVPIGETDASGYSVALSFDEPFEDENTCLLNSLEPTRTLSCWTRFKALLGFRMYTQAKLRRKPEESWDASELYADRDFCWWTKFYNSLYPEKVGLIYEFKHHLTIYMSELEKQPEFGALQDWAVPVDMVHGIKLRRNVRPKEEVYATLKVQLKLTPCQCAHGEAGDGDMLRPLAAAMNPKYQAAIQSLSEPCKISVRVYVVQGLQFNPRDKQTQADSFVKLKLGDKTISDRAHYVPNQSNPIYGKYFEFECLLPREHVLDITVYDRDKFGDDIIGCTHIDLEDRWRTKHRATVGIANEYTRIGYNYWRDINTPIEILNELCQKREIAPPHFYGKYVELDGVLFGDDTVISLNEDLHERLCLTVLKNLEQLPSFGYSLVPEHVETRSLYREDCPGIEQGKLQLWVELYEGNVYIPPPIDITPSPPMDFEVRIIVLNLKGVELNDTNIFGKHMSDIYVRGWCQDRKNFQATDVHYRSMQGEANFNWRMIFPLKYSPNEDMMVIRHRSGYFEEFEIKRPPTVYFQAWDKDFITRDDFLASVELNLSNLIEPYVHARQCTQLYDSQRKHLNLFRRKSVHGWFPMQRSPKRIKAEQKKQLLGGKIELELQMYTRDEASNQPAGLGHDPPNALAMPHRPDVSFNPLTNPFKSLRKIIWPVIRKYVLIFLLLAIIVLSMVLFFSNLPYHLMGLP